MTVQASEFKQKFLPLSRRMFWTAWRLTGNVQEAEDLVQEAYLKLWTKRDKLVGIQNTEAYCTTLVRNLYLNQVRQRKIQVAGPLDEQLTVTEDKSLEDILEQKDESQQVKDLIGHLPEKQRKVILLHDVEQWTDEDIQQQTGLKATHIRVLLSRARKTIRLKFNKRDRR